MISPQKCVIIFHKGYFVSFKSKKKPDNCGKWKLLQGLLSILPQIKQIKFKIHFTGNV